jgi:hypothetical protein
MLDALCSHRVLKLISSRADSEENELGLLDSASGARFQNEEELVVRLEE